MSSRSTSPLVRTRRRLGTALVAVALVVSGCTGALRSEDEPPVRPAEDLTNWPRDEVLESSTSPVQPDVDLAVRPLLRQPDGTTTLLAEVSNQGPDPVGIGEVFGSDGLVTSSRAPLVALEEPRDIPLEADGPAVSLPDPGATATSEAEPEWAMAGRAVVRVGDDRSVAYVDLTRRGGTRSWPQGLDGDLSVLAVIDPRERQRLGALVGPFGADGSSSSVAVPDQSTRTLHVAVPPVARGPPRSPSTSRASAP